MKTLNIFGDTRMTIVQAVGGLPFVEEDWMKVRKKQSIKNEHDKKSISKIIKTGKSYENNKLNP